MNPQKAAKIIENEEELNVGELAEAILEDKKGEEKRNHIPSMAKSHEAWQRIKAREQEKLAWRNRVAKVWPKKKQS